MRTENHSEFRHAFTRVRAALVIVMAWLLLCGFTKAATYNGKEWAVNFWSTEMNTLDEDFRQIREDGFNAVVLVIPWRQFQPSLQEQGRNADAYTRLARIMDAAEDCGLQVILRAGYTWDSYNSADNVSVRFRRLRSEEGVRKAWLRYLEDLYDAVKDHPAFGGAFLTWEDFWTFTEECASFGTGNTDIPQRSGYSGWVFDHYDPEEISRLYDAEITGPEQIWFPSAVSPARKLVYEWNDDWMNELLEESQDVFPGISMEVRLDIDPVSGTDGDNVGVPHNVTFSAGNAEFTSCMYAPTMGCSYGQEIGAEEAIGKAQTILGTLRAAAGKPVFVDQFLYTDNTPGYETNARVKPAELPDYIAGMAPVLHSMGKGYAVWTYRDYADNVIVNGEFGADGKDWKLSGGALIQAEDGNSRLSLQDGGRAEQSLARRNTSTETGDILQFDYEVRKHCRLRISAGSYVQDLILDDAGSIREEMHTFGEQQLAFSCLEGEVLIDNVKVYSHVTEGGIYSLDGTPGPYLEAVRALNAALPD